eukprot:2917115-Rhodomonas_salina.1
MLLVLVTVLLVQFEPMAVANVLWALAKMQAANTAGDAANTARQRTPSGIRHRCYRPTRALCDVRLCCYQVLRRIPVRMGVGAYSGEAVVAALSLQALSVGTRLSAYARAMRCPGLTLRMLLPASSFNALSIAKVCPLCAYAYLVTNYSTNAGVCGYAYRGTVVGYAGTASW